MLLAFRADFDFLKNLLSPQLYAGCSKNKKYSALYLNGNKQGDLIDSDTTVTKKQKILNHRETKTS